MASFKAIILISLVLCIALCADARQKSIKPRIVGGKDVSPNEFKYMAGIATQSTNFKWFICGGAIISERHILTSAGVIADYIETPQKLSIILGSPSYGENDMVNVAHIMKIVTHPNFKEDHLLNDIAVVLLKESIVFSETIQPIALPETDVTSDNGLIAVVTGWGLTKVRFSPA